MNFINKLMVVTFLLIHVDAGLMKGDDCSLNTGGSGICKLIEECPAAIMGLKKMIYPQLCGFQGTRAIVCCTQASPSTIRKNISTETSVTPKPTSTAPSEVIATPQGKSRSPGEVSNQKCVEYSKYVWTVDINPILSGGGAEIRKMECPFNRPLIVDAGFAVRRELPHMVQLGYDGHDGPTWNCGGSLISHNYVLTAAHCLWHPSLGDAKYARMGIVDLEDDFHMQQRNISKLIYHPDYEAPSHYNDIGLVRLDGAAELNTWVRPACLYTNNASTMSKVIASGWVTTNYNGKASSDLLRIILELYDQPACKKTYNRQASSVKLKEGIKDNIMICAGHSKERKPTCQGMSGGPIQIYRKVDDQLLLSCMYDIVGVTSFGRACEFGVNTPPAVYTRISAYTKWIEDIVWPPT